MKTLSLTLAMLIITLARCDARTDQPTEPVKAAQQTGRAAKKESNDKCDFSAYAPKRILYFAQGAVTKRVKPTYPPEAAQRGIQGRVVVKALVNESGVIERACVVEGDDALRQAAETAVLQWKFKPGYGLALSRPKATVKPQHYAEVYVVIDFKIDKANSKNTTTVKP
jgi:TonB family protein